MTPHPTDHKPKILVLFSDTGGGHRSAAEAVFKALEDKHKGQFHFEMVDVFKAYAPYPLSKMPELYPTMVRVPNLWGLGYRMVDGKHRTRIVMETMWPWIRQAAKQLIRDHPTDLILSVHPLFITPVMRALGKHRPPFITVVTDLVTTPNLWFHHRVDLCIVPTEHVRRNAIRNGLSPSQVRLLGLPVRKEFCRPDDPILLRKKLGWPSDRTVVLIVGGGEGMGPIYDAVTSIANANPECCIAVVAGKNQKLKQRLEDTKWNVPIFIYGFVSELPDFMKATDILVTKAGPSTISEAINVGLPMVLYSRIPGQEDGNVQYVVEEGVGQWAPGAEQTAKAVRRWVLHPRLRENAKTACLRIARPNAADDIASIIWEYLPQSEKVPLKS